MVQGKRVLRGLGFAAIAVAALAIAIVAILQIPSAATWVGRRLIGMAPLNPGYTMDARSVGGTWLGSLELHDVTLRHGDTALAQVDWVRVEYNPLRLLGAPTVRSVAVRGARITAHRRDATWDLAEAFRSGGDTASGNPLAIGRLTIENASLTAHRAPDSVVTIENLTVRVRDLVLADRTLLQLDTLAGTMTSSWNPGTPVTLSARGGLARDVIRLDTLAITSSRSHVSGRVVLPRQLDDARQVGQLAVNLRAAPLAMADVAPLFPALRPEGQLEADIAAHAQGREVTGTVQARLGAATLHLRGSTLAGVDAPVRMRLDGELKHLDPARVLHDGTPGALNGSVTFALDGDRLTRSDGRGELRLEQRRTGGSGSLALTTEIRNGRAELRLRGASGALAAVVAGWIRPFDSLPTYAVGGDVTLPAADTTLTVRFDLSGSGATQDRAVISGRAELAIAGGRITTRGQVVGDSALYRLDGTFDAIDLERFVADTQVGPISGRFTLAGRGFDPGRTTANARIDLDDFGYRGQLLRDIALRVSVRAARATLRSTGFIGAGRLLVVAQGARLDSALTFTVDSALLERVNLGALLHVPALDGPVTLRATANGRVAGKTRFIRAAAAIDPAIIREIRVAEARAQIMIDDARGQYEVALRTSGGALYARAHAASDSSYQFDGSLDSLNLGLLLARTDLTTHVDGRVTGSFTGRSLATANGHVDLALRQSQFNEATLGPGTARFELDSGRLKGRVALDTGDARIAMDLTGSTSAQQTEVAVRGTARLLALERWTRDATLEGAAQARVDLRATGDSSGLRSATGTLAADAHIGKLRIDTLYAKLDPGAGLVVDTVLVRSNVARFDGAGRLALNDDRATDTLRVTGRFGDVSPLRDMLATGQLSLDSAGVNVVVTGPASRRDVDLTGYARRFLYANTLVEQLDAEATATLGNSVDAVSGKIELRGLASRSVIVHSASFTGRYDSTFAVAGTADLGHGVGIDVATSGDRSGAATTIRIERIELREGGRIWTLDQTATVALGPHDITVTQFDLRSGERRVAIGGVVSFRDSSQFSVDIDQLELTGLARAGLLNVPGWITASLELRGPALSPVLAGNVALLLREDGSSAMQSELRWTRRGLRVNASALDQGGHTLLAAGSLPWGFALARPDSSDTRFVLLREPGDSLTLDIRGADFELGFFQPFLPINTATNLRGQLSADARVTGTPEHAAARGTARVEGLSLDVPLNAVHYRNGHMQAVLEGTLVRIDTLTLETGKHQRLAARGTVTLQPITDPRLDLTADLQDFAVANEGILETRASGGVQVTGTVANPVVTGSLVLGHTEFNAPAAAALEVEDVKLTPEDLLEVARHFGPRVLASVDAPVRVLDRFGLDLTVRLPEQVWFRRQATPKIDIEVTGRMRVRQEPYQEMQFFGTVEPLPGRSSIDLFGRTFELTGGDIALNGPIEQARINVTAQYRPPIEGGSDDNSVMVTVLATGRLDSLGLDFSSDPTMSRDDIISYIVTGRPASDNPLIAQSSGSQGENLVLGQLSEALTDVVSRQLGFDVFQIRQEPEQGLVLTAGRYVTPRFYASLQQPLELGSDAKRLPGTTLGPGFELQYRLSPLLRVNLRGGSLPFGILLRGRYAY